MKDEKINLRIESRFGTSTGKVHLTQFRTSFFEDQPGLPWSQGGVVMLGMSLLSFLVLTLIGAVVAVSPRAGGSQAAA